MSGGMKLLDKIEIDLRDSIGNLLTVHVKVHDNSLSRKWLTSLNELIRKDYHLEKNYCFFGFTESSRNVEYLLGQMNQSVAAINTSGLDYHIDDHFTMDNTIVPGPMGDGLPGGTIIHDKLNWLHRYFEDLQGVSGAISPHYHSADATTRWHIRQLNLLCHEYESLVLSMRKATVAPAWRRPSQLMCWLNAPRFILDNDDYELFGIESINRPLGGVFVGVNKAVGKSHFEVFSDEGRSVGELTTTTLKSQTEAAGDFDIEWANDSSAYHWQKKTLIDFRQWLVDNNFDPENKSLTIGHPQVGQVDLVNTFGTTDYNVIWKQLGTHLDVYQIRSGGFTAKYEYRWSDADFVSRQINRIETGN